MLLVGPSGDWESCGATIAEISGIALILSILILRFEFVGAIAAAIAFLGGRLVANVILLPSMRLARS